MKIYIISLFPEIFENFLNVSLIGKATQKGLIEAKIINPREFCVDKHRQIDDEIYGGGAGLLMKAQPIIDSVNFCIKEIKKRKGETFKIVHVCPSVSIFNQAKAGEIKEYNNLIFVCGRYEGIDNRFNLYCEREFGESFEKISLGKFVTLGGETPTMVMIEAICRLQDDVIGNIVSTEIESYSVENGMNSLEFPQYTRPESVEGFSVPEVLLSGNHKEIEKWRNNNSLQL